MEINVSQIIADKLAQMDNEGIIKKKIEDTLEKSVMDAITSELTSYSFRKGISDQVAKSVSSIAADCGFSAYNGFIAERVKAIVQDMFTADISRKVQEALNDVMLQKHENIKLSDIFRRYRAWVLENTEEAEKYERREYTGALEIEERGAFTHYVCRFADRPLSDSFRCGERPDVEIRFCVYGEEKETNISSLYLNGRNLGTSLKIGTLTEFEAFVVNLHYNGTKILLDAEDVDEYSHFDIDD